MMLIEIQKLMNKVAIMENGKMQQNRGNVYFFGWLFPFIFLFVEIKAIASRKSSV